MIIGRLISPAGTVAELHSDRVWRGTMTKESLAIFNLVAKPPTTFDVAPAWNEFFRELAAENSFQYEVLIKVESVPGRIY